MKLFINQDVSFTEIDQDATEEEVQQCIAEMYKVCKDYSVSHEIVRHYFQGECKGFTFTILAQKVMLLEADMGTLMYKVIDFSNHHMEYVGCIDGDMRYILTKDTQ